MDRDCHGMQIQVIPVQTDFLLKKISSVFSYILMSLKISQIASTKLLFCPAAAIWKKLEDQILGVLKTVSGDVPFFDRMC